MAAVLASTKILATGANGFIGLHTALHLLQLGYRVRGTVRTQVHEKKSGKASPNMMIQASSNLPLLTY